MTNPNAWCKGLPERELKNELKFHEAKHKKTLVEAENLAETVEALKDELAIVQGRRAKREKAEAKW